MGTTEDLLAFIPTIYDAALDPTLWASVLQRCTNYVGGHCGLLARQGLDYRSGQSIAHGIDPAAMASYFGHYAGLNVFAPRGAAVAPGTIDTDRDIMPTEEFRRTEFYNDFLSKQLDANTILTSLLLRNGHDTVWITMCRGAKDRIFEASDKEALRLVMPHLESAMRISLRLGLLEARISQTLEAFDKTPHAVLVLNGEGKILFANGRAESLLRSPDAIAACADGLHGATHALTEKLRRLIARAATGAEAGAMSLPKSFSKGSLHAVVAPCNPEQDWLRTTESRVLLLLHDTDSRPLLAPHHLQAIFDLSPAEARIAVKLHQGLDLKNVADALGISRHTARVHLNSILTKTGTHKQSELMRRLVGVADLCTAAHASENGTGG